MNGDTYELLKDGAMLAFIEERPRYCNRGRVHANIQAPVHISDADPWPRYYFVLAIAMSEVKSWLVAHGVDLAGASWNFRPAPPDWSKSHDGHRPACGLPTHRAAQPADGDAGIFYKRPRLDR